MRRAAESARVRGVPGHVAAVASCACCCSVDGKGLQVLPERSEPRDKEIQSSTGVSSKVMGSEAAAQLHRPRGVSLRASSALFPHLSSRLLSSPLSSHSLRSRFAVAGPAGEVGMARQTRQRQASGATKFRDLSALCKRAAFGLTVRLSNLCTP